MADMLVKSRDMNNFLGDLRKTFEVLKTSHMRLIQKSALWVSFRRIFLTIWSPRNE